MTASASAFLRLFRNLYTLVSLWFLIMAGAWPAIMIGEKFGENSDLFSPAVLTPIVWAEAVSLLGVTGLLTSVWVASAHGSSFAFVVPNLRGRILSGRRMAGIVLCLLPAMLIAYLSGWLAGITVAAAGYASYAAAGAMHDSASPPFIRWVFSLAFLAFVLRPGLAEPVLSYSPVATILVCIVVALTAFRVESSTDAARRRAIVTEARVRLDHPLFRLLGLSRVDRTHFRASPASGRLRDWVAASYHESFGILAHGRLKYVAAMGGYLAFFGFLIQSPEFAPTMVILAMGAGSFGLTGWAYPLDRGMRADVLFLRGSIDTLSLIAVVWPAVYLLTASSLPHSSFFEGRHEAKDIWMIWPLVIAWAPAVQWAGVTSPLRPAERQKSVGLQARFFGGAMVGIVGLTMTRIFIGGLAGNSPGWAIALSVAIIPVAYFAYWMLLRRHFAKADLI